jgi:hypothetical protein
MLQVEKLVFRKHLVALMGEAGEIRNDWPDPG